VLGRGALFVPRVAFDVVLAPVRVGVYTVERHHLIERVYAIFFNDAGTIGLYPTARIESGYGLNVGARFVHRDLLGHDEHLTLHAATGGRFRQIFKLAFRSGELFGDRIALELEPAYERRPKDAFYGLGNSDGMESRYRKERARIALAADLRVTGDLHLRGSGALAHIEVGPSTHGTSIDEVYDTAMLAGYGSTREAYGELELRWDSRRRTSSWESQAIPTTGWLAAVFAGHMAVAERPDFRRYGFDLQHFLRITGGPRVIGARLHAETVTGRRDDVPFFDLPALGGPSQLRGYPLERFRDRLAAVGSIEYAWDLSPFVAASAFVDTGGTFATPRDIDARTFGVGYGLAVQGHTAKSFLVRLSLASSIDGGVFLDLALDPVFDLESRVERR
jgi:outer membrane protein assembly factor BamA